MKKFLFLAVALLGLVSCEETIFDPIQDKPYINILEEAMSVEAAGSEELIITLESTGVDGVTISSGETILDYWTATSETNSNAIDGSWIEIIEVIEEYNSGTRALPIWNSAIVVRIKANETGAERKATISATSFTKNDTITISQLAE